MPYRTACTSYPGRYTLATYVLDEGQQAIQKHLHVGGVGLVLYGIKKQLQEVVPQGEEGGRGDGRGGLPSTL